MKCIKNKITGRVIRVTNEEATKLLAKNKNKYSYTTKSTWKQQGRNYK